MTLRYDEAEYAAVCAAAASAHMTTTSYVAQTALAAATNSRPPHSEPLAAALIELMAARTQVRRFGSNVNQAVRHLNATGSPPVWLEKALDMTTLAVARLDEAAATLTRTLR